jgi:hypothetical protein
MVWGYLVGSTVLLIVVCLIELLVKGSYLQLSVSKAQTDSDASSVFVLSFYLYNAYSISFLRHRQ